MDRGTYHRARGLFGCFALGFARSTIDPPDPKGQNEIAQGKAKRRPANVLENADEDVVRVRNDEPVLYEPVLYDPVLYDPVLYDGLEVRRTH